MHAVLRCAVAVAFAAIAFSVHGQVTFDRPVRIIVTAAPGGLTDTLARGLAQRLTPVWGQPVVVENRPGANNIIGAELVAKSAPDGYTFLVTEASTFVINPFLHKKLPYDPVQDFTPISVIGATANVIAVPVSLGVNSLPEFVAKAKEKPGAISFGSTGPGSYAHIASEQLSRLTGIQMTHVAYKGSSPLHLDLVAGNISMYIGHISGAMMQQREVGKLRFLASATRNRLPQFPDIPTASEVGAPGFEANTWFGILAPAKLPPAVLSKVHADIVEAIRSPEYQQKYIAPNNLQLLAHQSPAEFRDYIAADAARWKPLVESSGAKTE
jgi:tripartite-type tricarboxylate transporter receptor subunit TctC